MSEMIASNDLLGATARWMAAVRQKWVEMQRAAGAPWIGPLDEPVEFLAGRSWQATLTQAGADDANYGRWPFPVIPITMPNMPHNWYVTARKEAAEKWLANP